MQKPGAMAGFIDIVVLSTQVKTGCYMDISSVTVGLITTVIGGAFVTWLYGPADANLRALRRLKIMGSILYKVLGLLGALGMVISCAFEFYRFAYSEAPIQRLEIVGLFFYMLNFFVYLLSGLAILMIWINPIPRKRQ